MAGVAVCGAGGCGEVVTGGTASDRATALDHREYNIAAMVLLALETVTRAGSLALFTDRGVAQPHAGDPRARTACGCPTRSLRVRRTPRSYASRDVDSFVVVTGPGFVHRPAGWTGDRSGTGAGASAPVDRRSHARRDGQRLARHAIAGRDGLLVTSSTARAAMCSTRPMTSRAADRIEPARVVIEARVATPIGGGDGNRGRRHAAGRSRSSATGPSGTRRPCWRRRRTRLFETPMPNLAAAAARLGRAPAGARRPPACAAADLHPAARRRTGAGARPACEFAVFEVTTADDVAEVADLQARAFGDAWGAEAIGAELANNSVAQAVRVRHRSASLIALLRRLADCGRTAHQ